MTLRKSFIPVCLWFILIILLSYLYSYLYTYTEIKPAYKTFAFSNPVIRIIDIRDPEKQGK